MHFPHILAEKGDLYNFAYQVAIIVSFAHIEMAFIHFAISLKSIFSNLDSHNLGVNLTV